MLFPALIATIALLHILLGAALAVQVWTWARGSRPATTNSAMPPCDRLDEQQPIAEQEAVESIEELASLPAESPPESVGDSHDSNSEAEELPHPWDAAVIETTSSASWGDDLGFSKEPPASWNAWFAKDARPGTPLELILCVLELSAVEVLRTLTIWDGELRADPAAHPADIENGLCYLGMTWNKRRLEIAGYLEAHHDELGGLALLAANIQEALAEQTVQWGGPHEPNETENLLGSVESRRSRVLDEIQRLFSLVRVIRDRVSEWHLVLRRDDERGYSPPAQLATDSMTGLLSRIGLDDAFSKWRAMDVENARVICLALIDVDDFGSLNRQLGIEVGDRLLSEFANLLRNLVRTTRGFDRLARLSGDRYCALLGDTGPRKAAQLLERIRQTAERTDFMFRGSKLPLTVTGSATEVLPKEPLCRALQRLERSLKVGKRHSRNVNVIDESSGPVVLPPSLLDIRGDAIELSREDVVTV